MKLLRSLTAGLVAAAFVLPATSQAASIPFVTGPWDPSNALGTINSWINNSLQPSEGLFVPLATPRNLLDNGAGFVQQRGTGTVTCGTTSGPGETAYGADRWACDSNMASAAGRMVPGQTTSPTPPPGFSYQTQVYRTSGSLPQPICAEQEVPTWKAVQAAGQQVDFSVYATALGNMIADNAGAFNLYVITGTTSGGADGLGTGRSAVGMTTTTKQSSMTISTSTGVITNATTVVAGQPVTITASTMPSGINAGQIYYVSSASLNSGTSFTIAPTYAAAIAGTNTVIPSTGGSTVVINVGYITPVWTGLAVYGPNNAGQGQTSAAQAYGQATANGFTLTANWQRLQTGPISIPNGVTEMAVLACFPPGTVASGSSTDGFAFTGAQLEILQTGQTSASSYEFRDPAVETLAAQRYYYQITDSAAHTVLSPVGIAETTARCDINIPFPVQMDAAPTFAAVGSISTSTFKVAYVAAAEATFGAAAQPATTNTVNSTLYGAVSLTSVTGSPLTAGNACSLVGQTAQAIGLSWGADF